MTIAGNEMLIESGTHLINTFSVGVHSHSKSLSTLMRFADRADRN